MADLVAWSNDTPGDDSAASLMDDAIRTSALTLETGLNESMFWPGSGDSGGYMRAETARSFWTGSATSVAGGSRDGVMGVLANDYLFHAGSEKTFQMLGGYSMQEHAVSFGTTARWVTSDGTIEQSIDTSSPPTSTEKSIAFGTTYDIPPIVFMTIQNINYGDSDADILYVAPRKITESTCVSYLSSTFSVNATHTEEPDDGAAAVIYWHSLGTVSF